MSKRTSPDVQTSEKTKGYNSMNAKKTLYMETTTVPAERTAAEICSVLIGAGATQISTDYTAGRITGLRWLMPLPGRGDVVFSMPARIEPVFKVINGRHVYASTRIQKAAQDREQAQRVAWRQLLRWVQAQVAMIQCGMAEAGEVFFAYVHIPQANSTLYELAKGSGFKAIEGPQ